MSSLKGHAWLQLYRLMSCVICTPGLLLRLYFLIHIIMTLDCIWFESYFGAITDFINFTYSSRLKSEFFISDIHKSNFYKNKVFLWSKNKAYHTRYSFMHTSKQTYHCLSTVNILIAYHLWIIWNEPYCYLHSLKTNFLPLLYQNIVNLLKSFNSMKNWQK